MNSASVSVQLVDAAGATGIANGRKEVSSEESANSGCFALDVLLEAVRSSL